MCLGVTRKDNTLSTTTVVAFCTVILSIIIRRKHQYLEEYGVIKYCLPVVAKLFQKFAITVKNFKNKTLLETFKDVSWNLYKNLNDIS